MNRKLVATLCSSIEIFYACVFLLLLVAVYCQDHSFSKAACDFNPPINLLVFVSQTVAKAEIKSKNEVSLAAIFPQVCMQCFYLFVSFIYSNLALLIVSKLLDIEKKRSFLAILIIF